MKNRRIVIAAFLCIAMLVVGIGYAAVTNTLDIAGTGEIDRAGAEAAFKADVFFAGVVVGDTLKDSVVEADALGYTANINTNNNDKAQFTVNSFQGAGETASITFRVHNVGDLAAELLFKTSYNSNPTYFDITYWVGNTQIAEGTSGVKFADITAATDDSNPGFVDITVKIVVKATPTDTQTLSSSFEFDVTADN